MNELGTQINSADSFLVRVGVELKRAERYRFFVSVIALDLSFTRDLLGEESFQTVSSLLEKVQTNIRVIDDVSVVGSHRLVLLLPETTRQGAEIAAKRLSELIRDNLSTHTSSRFEDMIPLEMASYPDAAGAKTVKDFMGELSKQSRN